MKKYKPKLPITKVSKELFPLECKVSKPMKDILTEISISCNMKEPELIRALISYYSTKKNLEKIKNTDKPNLEKADCRISCRISKETKKLLEACVFETDKPSKSDYLVTMLWFATQELWLKTNTEQAKKFYSAAKVFYPK